MQHQREMSSTLNTVPSHGHHIVPNHRQLDCLRFHILFKLTTKDTSKLSIVFELIHVSKIGPRWSGGWGAWWRHQMKHFPRYWPFVRGIHRPPVNSPHKGQWRGALMHIYRINDFWLWLWLDVFFDLCLNKNKRLRKQSWGWLFETLSRPLWRRCNEKDSKTYGREQTSRQ